jgi:hypothetical protein
MNIVRKLGFARLHDIENIETLVRLEEGKDEFLQADKIISLLNNLNRINIAGQLDDYLNKQEFRQHHQFKVGTFLYEILTQVQHQSAD